MPNHLFLLGLLAAKVSAGAGAVVYGCIYYPSANDDPISISFNAGGSNDNCLNASGQDADFIYPNGTSGVVCANCGYVEEKNSGGCFFETAKWNLGYSAAGKSGSTLSDWSESGGNSATFENAPAGTYLCGSPNLCYQNSTEWEEGTTGPIYIVFQPDYSTSGLIDQSHVDL